ncbi:MAG: Ig-like domain-containing protein [Gemmatimonadaceae bacterium]|nr:Ig-like domain-containing protein [Gemmatimonadaceae bacterium]
MHPSLRLPATLLAVLAACTPTDTTTAPGAVEVASVVVAPDSAVGDIGGSLQLSASARDANGQAIGGERVSWTSSTPSVASVDSLGRVTFLSAGTSEITAAARGRSGRGRVTVRPPTLQSLVLTPTAATLDSGATQQFAVAGTWSDGSTATPPVVFTATGGTITTGGLYRAGAAAGTFRVIARHEASGRADTSAVTISVPPPAAPTLTGLVLAPASVSLDSGATRQFSVTGTWSDGATTPPTVVYTATGGTITTGGLYRAGAAAGTFRVIARHEASGRADTSAVTITVPPPAAPTLTGLVLAPASVSLDSGATRQFSVTGTWSDGATTPPTVVYTATGGTITSGGLYRAGAAAGTFRVIARHEASGRADTSAVTITVPPPPSGSALVNECATPRAGWIWCDDFDQDRLASYFEFEQANGAFARVGGVGNDGSFGMRARWSAGQVSAGALHLAIGRTPQSYFRPADAGTANYRELYWRVYLRNQPGWTGGGGDKLSRAFIYASSTSWAQAMIAHVWSGDNTASRDMLMIDPARGTDAAGNLVTTGYNDFAHLTWIGAVHGTTPIFATANAGVWRCIEAHVRLNDAGQANGLMELWINGTPEATRTGLNFVGSYSAYGLNAVFLENYWNAGSPVAQERYMDNFVVSTQRIGC